MRWIKTENDQRVNAAEIQRMSIQSICAANDHFRYALILNMRNGDEIVYSRSELLKEEFHDEYRPADAVRSEECRRALLAQMDHLTEYELA